MTRQHEVYDADLLRCPDSEARWVKVEDYDQLATEVERLRARVAELTSSPDAITRAVVKLAVEGEREGCSDLLQARIDATAGNRLDDSAVRTVLAVMRDAIRARGEAGR
jgi:hypothetical protein